jgi:hypothetical protein
MMKNIVVVAALCGACPAFAAAAPDAAPTSVAAAKSDSRGSSLDNTVVAAIADRTTIAMVAAGVLGLFGLSRRRGRAP